MKKKVLAVVFVLAPLLSMIAGTPFVSLGEANPFWWMDTIPSGEHTNPPVISIVSPANNIIINQNNVVLSFKMDVGEL